MNTHTDPRTRVLHTDDQLRDMIDLLLQKANIRQMWLMFIDQNGCLGDPIMPMADYPRDPFEIVSADDLGEVAHAHLLMRRAEEIREAVGNAQIVFVWERRGGEKLRDDELTWARAMAEQAADQGVPLRAQFVLHSGGARQLHADDYL